MKTEKSTTSRQSFNSKSEENPGENENKKNNSKDQSIDSKRSENIDSQLRMQNYITEVRDLIVFKINYGNFFRSRRINWR